MSLSIADFQKISNGYHNAGDITLTGRGKLDMVNNHVGVLKGWNTKTVSAATTLEVKNAFVQALKNAGVDEAALSKVREDLGLPKDGGTKGLDMSRLKPLTRAQTREILDRYAGVINEKAQRTVVSNRWAHLMGVNGQNYRTHSDLAETIGHESAKTRAAAQRKLGIAIMDYGAGEIPSNIRKSATYSSLSAADKESFSKIFTSMLFHGGADVNSIAAEAMKKVLVSKYGSGIENEAERDAFKGFVLDRPATTDLARIEQDVKDAKAAAASGAKPETVVKFTSRDAVPLELHKMNVIENAKKLASNKGQPPLTDDEVLSMMDEMSKWEDIQPGRMKKFEAWAKDDVTNYINKSIGGDDLGGKKRPLEFDEDGLCTQFRMDCYRSQITIVTPKSDKPDENGQIKDDAKVYTPSAKENKEVCDHFRKMLPNKADRSFVSALMNQSAIASIAILVTNSVIDPDDKSENPPTLRGLDPEGEYAPNFEVNDENTFLGIMQPSSLDSSRYELRVDDKNKTAKLTITADYELKPTINMRTGAMMADGKIGVVASSYEIQITGLGSGDPQIASVGFRQEVEALDMK